MTGVQRYSHELINALDKVVESEPNIKLEILCPPRAKPIDLRNIQTKRVGVLSGHAWEQLELPMHVRQRILFCPGNLAPIVSLYGKIVFTTIHDLSYRYFPQSYSKSFRLGYNFIVPHVLARSKTIFTVSKSEAAAIQATYPACTTPIIPIQNGGGFTTASRTMQAREANTLLYVGSLSRRKNFQGLMRAASALNAQSGTQTLIAGSLPPGLHGEFEPGKSWPGVTFLGQVEDATRLKSLYERASCFLFPSFYEASPLPPLEAMSYGCPVAVSAIPSLQERCGNAALYFDPNNVNSIVEVVQTLLTNDSASANLVRLGYERAAALTWKRCAEATLTALIEAL